MPEDHGLETLLTLNGETFRFEGGFSVRIQAWRVDPVPEIPHGIRYSLTLHDRYGARLAGYDNAHGVRPRTKAAGKRTPFDHRHRSRTDKGVSYAYRDAAQLLEDFFEEVEEIMKRMRQP